MTNFLAILDDDSVAPLEIDVTCSGTECTREAVSSIPAETIRASDLVQVEGGTTTPVLTKHGITLLQYAGANLVSYGAWLDHAGFTVQRETGSVQDVGGYRAWYGVAGGDRTRSAPETGMEARWDGLLVGMIGVRGAGDVVQGDTVLRWHDPGSGQQLDIAFTNIQNLSRSRAHGQDYAFENLALETNGTFSRSTAESYVQGAFYGPDHAEAAGTVELGNPRRAGIVGAFGAKKAQ